MTRFFRLIFTTLRILFFTWPVFALSFSFCLAQDKLSLSITPPLIKVNFSPGQIWQSSVKIVNNNPNDLNVFVTVMDFKSGPEGGIIFLKEKSEENKRFLLSQWIEFPKEEIIIPAFQSKSIPFSIKVPPDAEAGGKYAAILVGTKPSEEISGTMVKITPLVSSLILANVRGDVREAVWIREFSTDKTVYQSPNVNFTLKIENIGNVHVQPQGEIKILNMYGKERGLISFNQKSEYGNILPNSSRKWNFSWKGEHSLFEIGRYKAILSVNYGNEIKRSENREIYFWVLPMVPLLIVFGSIFLFFASVFLLAKIYIKKTVTATLEEAKKQLQLKSKIEEKIPSVFPSSGKRVLDISVASAKKVREKTEDKERIKGFGPFRKKYFYLIIPILFFTILIIAIYFADVLKETKDYKVEGETNKELLTPEKVIEKIEQDSEENKKDTAKEVAIDKNSFSVSILNGSGIKGLANELARKLKEEGFRIEKIGNADRFDYQRTLISYKKGKEKEAKFLSDFLGGKHETKEVENQKEEIILIIGRDFSF